MRYDQKSFFAVVLFMAIRYDNEKWENSSLARVMSLNQIIFQIYCAKSNMLRNRDEFKKRALNYLFFKIPDDERFKKLLENMRFLLYSLNSDDIVQKEEIIEDCEDLFKRNMSFIDEFLGDRYGVTSL